MDRISLLSDNTVVGSYGGKLEQINSTHVHKAKSVLSEAIANEFEYVGAVENIDPRDTLVFDIDRCVVLWRGIVIDPTYTLTVSPRVKRFVKTVYTVHENMYGELWELKQLKDEPAKQKTKLSKQNVIKIIDGVPYVSKKFVEVPVTKTMTALDAETGKPTKTKVKVPVMDKAKTVSSQHKKRLAFLLSEHNKGVKV